MFLNKLDLKQKETFMCLAHVIAVSDGELSPEERLMMNELKREIDLSPEFQQHCM